MNILAARVTIRFATAIAAACTYHSSYAGLRERIPFAILGAALSLAPSPFENYRGLASRGIVAALGLVGFYAMLLVSGPLLILLIDPGNARALEIVCDAELPIGTYANASLRCRSRTSAAEEETEGSRAIDPRPSVPVSMAFP